jgi:RNA polymerase sigma-70 factor, ECF subfamily
MTTTDMPTSAQTDALQSFEALALPFVDTVYRAAYHLTRQAAEAEDLTQDTYLRAFQAFGGFRGAHAKVWLLTILRNAYIDRYRQRRPDPLDIDDVAASADPVGALGALLTPGAEDELLAAGLAEEVDCALMALPAEWRLVVVLADLEGLSYTEIADITQTPIGTVMSRLHRSRKRLHVDLLQFARAAGFATEIG